jgi:hypothetical protein
MLAARRGRQSRFESRRVLSLDRGVVCGAPRITRGLHLVRGREASPSVAMRSIPLDAFSVLVCEDAGDVTASMRS